MERARTSLLVIIVLTSSLAAQPIRQLKSYSDSFEGPALALECVGLLKADPAHFLETVRSKAPDARRICVNELMQSITSEPEFTSDDFQKAVERDPLNLLPEDPRLARRMAQRIGVNLNAARAIARLADARLVDDSGAIRPLIRCLNYPLLDVSRLCEDALLSLTRHSYGWGFFYNQPPAPTEEARQRFIVDWTEWAAQMRNGHPIFDEWLATQSLRAVHALGERLADVLKDTFAHGYLDQQVSKNATLGNVFGSAAETIFQYHVGADVASNWWGTKLDGVGIRLLRPGISKPAPSGQNIYSETFPALDLEVRIEIATNDNALRNACFLATREALNSLRSANELASAQR